MLREIVEEYVRRAELGERVTLRHECQQEVLVWCGKEISGSE